MNKISIFTILLLLIFCAGQMKSQDFSADTVLANKHYETANEYYNSKSYDTAAIYFVKVSEIYEKHKLWEKYLKSETKHVECYQRQWKLDKAISILAPAIKKTTVNLNEKNETVINAYHKLGLFYYFQYKLNEALKYWEKTLQLRRELHGENHMLTANSYINAGIIYSIKNDYEPALEHYFKSLSIYKELVGEKHTSVAACYNNIGIVYDDKKEYDLALEYYDKALQLRRELLGEKHALIATSYTNLGIVYGFKEEYERALEYQIKSLELNKELLGEKHSEVGMSYYNIGNTYFLMKKYEPALENIFKSLEIRKELFGEKHTTVAYSYLSVGSIFSDNNELDSAIYYTLKSLEINKDLLGKKHMYVAMAYNNLAVNYQYKKDYRSALRSYHKGIIANLSNYNDSADIYSVPDVEGYLSWDELLKSLSAKAEIFANHNEELSELNNLSGLKLALSCYQVCDTLILKVRKEMKTKSDKLSLGEQATGIYIKAVKVCEDLSRSAGSSEVSNKYKKLAFSFSEKNKSSVLMEALAGVEAKKFSGIPDSLLKQEHKLRVNIALYKKILAQNPDSMQRAEFNDKLFKANRQYDSLVSVFEKKYQKYFDLKYNVKPVEITDIQNVIDKHSAVLSYFLGENTLSIFVLTNKKFDVFKVDDTDNMIDIVSELRENISNTFVIADDYNNNTNISVEYFRTESPKLYEILFPLELRKFLGRKIKNLIIIPDSYLSTLPFETLLTQEYSREWTGWKNTDYFTDMPFLIKDYNISYSYSSNLFYQTHPKTKDKPEFQDISDWLALAPVFDNDSISGTNLRTRQLIENNTVNESGSLNTRAWLRDGTYISPLPGSEEETKNIFKIFENNNRKAILKTHKYANEEYMKSGVLNNFRYLHIASHGMVNEEKPELSCILLAQDTITGEDNILFSGEIYNLDLNADLTVLSACETGLGKIAKGEGVIGLTRALLYAGSKNIIVSLWQVSDESTNQMMVDFYRNIFKNNYEGFSENLSQSKRKLINEGKYAHPFFWSPFVLIGK